MKVTLQAVRVYGSHARYGSPPRLDPLGRPITLPRYPAAADGQSHHSAIYLGPPVASVVQAARVRRAIGHILLGWLTGAAPQDSPDQAIDEALKQVEDSWSSVWDWYITIVIERDIDVDDHLINANRYAWLDGHMAYQYEDSFRAFAAPYIDRIAVYIGTVIDPVFLQTVVLTDRVFFAAANRTPFGLPRSASSAQGALVRPLNDLHLDLLEQRLQAGAVLTNEQHAWLDDATHWYLAALGEQDVWKQFFWFYLCLEILSEQLALRLYTRAMDALGVKPGDPCAPTASPLVHALCTQRGRIASSEDVLTAGRFLRGKFALLSQVLFPGTSDAEFATFDRLTIARNSLAHGDPFDVLSLPLDDARSLAQRVLTAALVNYLAHTQ